MQYSPNTLELLGELVANAKEHGLVLFVGAGINAGSLAQWNELLFRLLGKAIQHIRLEEDRIDSLASLYKKISFEGWCRGHFDVCALASVIKSILGPERYRLEIQDALYANKQGR